VLAAAAVACVQVEGLSAEVARLHGHHVVQGGADEPGGLQEQIKQLTESFNKRHSRMETAIYQVGGKALS
jgi:hypothetical protein